MTGQQIGYIRVSSFDQHPERQLDGMALDRSFIDTASGKDVDRPQLEALMTFVRSGDTVVVHSMDRLARNLDDLRRVVQCLTARGVRIQFLKEHLTFTGDDSPMAHLMLAARCAECHYQRAQRCRFLAFQGGAQLQRRSRRVAQHDTEGIEPYDERGPLLERRTHALALGIAAVGQDDIPWSQGEMLERFAGVDIADQHLDKLQGHQVYRDVQAMIGACRAWGLNTAGVDHHKAPPRGQGLHGGHGEHLP